MIILFGKEIPLDKQVRYALPKIFGIGKSLANKICDLFSIPHNLKTYELTEKQVSDITTYIKTNFVLDSILKSVIKQNIRTFKDIKIVRGFRHRSKLPVRGQRTHSNGKTRKKGF